MKSNLNLDVNKSRHQVAAFFDVDDTLITIKSMFDFFDYWVVEQNLPEMKSKFDAVFQEARKQAKPREELNKMYYEFFVGQSIDVIAKSGREWFQRNVLSKNVFIDKTVQRLKAHKVAGDRIVFVSGSMSPLLQPIADYLDVDDLLCTNLIVDDMGFLTGQIGSIQTIGRGKSDAMTRFAFDNDINLTNSYAYGDDISDMHMLLVVGNPVYVGKQLDMLEYAQKNDWQVIA